MLEMIWAFLTSPTVMVPITLCTTTISIISVYDSAILVRSKGDEKKAQHLYAKAGLYVLLPISFVAFISAITIIAMDRGFGFVFVIVGAILFVGLCMCVYTGIYVLRPEFKMVPWGDRMFEKLLGKWFGDDMAVVLGRSLVTIVPLAAVILTFVEYYGPKAL